MRGGWAGRLGIAAAAAIVALSGLVGAQRPVENETPVPVATVLTREPTSTAPPPVTWTPVVAPRTPRPTPPTPTSQPPTPRATVAPPIAVPAPARSAAGPTRTPVAPHPLKLPLNGMGYNPTYATADVPVEQRDARIWRDMRLMAEAGVTMVLGWEPELFDETLVSAAEANGIAVLLPFDLKPAYNYAEPATRDQITAAVLAWIEHYRDKPSVAMWAIGNEVTLELSDAERRDFAEYYAELFERVRAADPSRPVVLREAEDVFAPYLVEAFARRGLGTPVGEALKAPNGFVYGVNFYTDRVGPALADWVENTGLDAPLIVSEYAPAGAGYAGRADGFARMHAGIVAAGPRVLGSAPYVWTTAGPEAVDAYFGLVDERGQPVDGALAEIARLYGVEPPGWARVGAGRQLATAAELPALIDRAVAVAERRADDPEDPVAAEVARRAREAAQGAIAGEGADRYRAVNRLADLARELAAVHRGHDSLFPGMQESVPLLDGMARWSAVEPSAGDTARSYLAAVLRRDLASLRE